MKGKILTDGVISGDDGNRYTYESNELKNNSSVSAGSEVDFQIKGGKAVDIYVTKQAFSVDKAFLSKDLQGIKFKVFVMFGCYLLAVIPFIGVIFGLAGIVLYVLVVLALKEASQSTSLLKNWILSMMVVFFGAIIITISGGGIILSFSSNSSGLNGLGIGAIAGLLLGFLIVASSFYYAYLYYKELAHITNEPFFMYYFWCYSIGALTTLIYIGLLLLLVAAVLWIIAWIRVKELRKSYSAIE